LSACAIGSDYDLYCPPFGNSSGENRKRNHFVERKGHVQGKSQQRGRCTQEDRNDEKLVFVQRIEPDFTIIEQFMRVHQEDLPGRLQAL